LLREQIAVVSGAECIKALGKIGFEVYRQRGSHIVLVRKSPQAQTTIPNHKEVDRDTLRAIIRQTGLTVEEFVGLL
jgi:predicted RNA binding protein YcfA (HicA-like mRNA interferase family)